MLFDVNNKGMVSVVGKLMVSISTGDLEMISEVIKIKVFTLMRTVIVLLLAAVSFTGCASYKVADTSSCCCPHPADCSVSILPVKVSQTLDIENDEKLMTPKNNQQEHQMDHGDHV